MQLKSRISALPDSTEVAACISQFVQYSSGHIIKQCSTVRVELKHSSWCLKPKNT